jgi:hypothetical protein
MQLSFLALVLCAAALGGRRGEHRAAAQSTLKYVDMTPDVKLLAAARDGNNAGVKEAMLGGADVNHRDPLFGMTALHFAVNQGWLPTVREIITFAPNLGITDNDGQTPLMLAAARASLTAIAKVLIGAASDAATLNVVDKRGRTALIWATQHRHEKVVRALLARGANKTMRAHDGMNALEKAEQRMSGDGAPEGRPHGPLGDAVVNMLKFPFCQHGGGDTENTQTSPVTFHTPGVGRMIHTTLSVPTCNCGLSLCDISSGMYCNSGNSWCAKHPIPKCAHTMGSEKNPGVACSCGVSNCCTAINLPHCKKVTGLYCYKDRSTCRDNREFFGYTSYGIQNGHHGL